MLAGPPLNQPQRHRDTEVGPVSPAPAGLHYLGASYLGASVSLWLIAFKVGNQHEPPPRVAVCPGSRFVKLAGRCRHDGKQPAVGDLVKAVGLSGDISSLHPIALGWAADPT